MMGAVRVLVVAAMRSEMKAFRKRWSRAGSGDDGGDVVTGVLGIGTSLARSSTELLVGETSPGHVLVVGIAGGIGPTTAIGDLVVPAVVLDGASGVERRPAPIGGLDERGTLHTSDELIVEPARIAELVARGVVALDMETAAVAEVCDEHGIPWSVMRGISDHADAELLDPAILGLMGPEGEPRPAAVARYLARHPNRMGQLARLSKGLDAAMAASSDAAMVALRGLSR
jgi:adenosylhomocysteine nucleosidase